MDQGRVGISLGSVSSNGTAADQGVLWTGLGWVPRRDRLGTRTDCDHSTQGDASNGGRNARGICCLPHGWLAGYCGRSSGAYAAFARA